MSLLDPIKANWRLLLLVVFVGVSLLALFIPGGLMADDSPVEGEEESAWTDDPLNLEYGLGLEGGTQIRAPVIGMHAENIEPDAVDRETGEVDWDRLDEIEDTLDEELGLETGDASVDFNEDSGTVTAEVFTDEVTAAEFAAALQAAGVDVDEDDIEDGVTQETRDQIISTIDLKVNQAGLGGGQVTQASMAGQYYIVTEVPDMEPDELRELLSERGVVEVVAYYPDEEGNQTNETVLETDDIADVDPPTYTEGQGYQVPVQVTAEAAPEFQDDMNEMGFTNEGRGMCSLTGDGEQIDFDHTGEEYCLLTVVDGEVVDAHSMGDLADGMAAETWADNPSFFMGAQNQQQAQSLSINLQAGELRAPLDFDEGDTMTLEPALADQFKLYSLLIGGLAVLTVSGMVFIRYRDPRVALPMIVTAMAEVLILLGFVALIRMPLDLSHVAGFIAVVGTGVDDLIIIADEVMSEGDVNSERVFESRFRKAFWIIGAAAATTIIAMSPLAVMQLGDLTGFAIITILGILVGVLVTRPAYGDILRRLLTDK
ncbi:preprotein translocase subunit SecD [Halobacteria archaeon AArc-dxtr1]|nr:preprotein translocase subunit SecD [Halobacteria archaeon AArc-dxtr1]